MVEKSHKKRLIFQIFQDLWNSNYQITIFSRMSINAVHKAMPLPCSKQIGARSAMSAEKVEIGASDFISPL